MSFQILLVDDDPNICETAKDILEDAGYSVLTAGTVAEALMHLREDPVHIMITDLNLPDGSGIDLASQARSQFPRLPILLMTGQADGPEPAGLAARNNGIVDDYLVKPVSPPQLLKRLERLLNQ